MLSFIFYHHPNPISLILNIKYGIDYNPTQNNLNDSKFYLFSFLKKKLKKN